MATTTPLLEHVVDVGLHRGHVKIRVEVGDRRAVDMAIPYYVAVALDWFDADVPAVAIGRDATRVATIVSDDDDVVIEWLRHLAAWLVGVPAVVEAEAERELATSTATSSAMWRHHIYAQCEGRLHALWYGDNAESMPPIDVLYDVLVAVGMAPLRRFVASLLVRTVVGAVVGASESKPVLAVRPFAGRLDIYPPGDVVAVDRVGDKARALGAAMVRVLGGDGRAAPDEDALEQAVACAPYVRSTDYAFIGLCYE